MIPISELVLFVDRDMKNRVPPVGLYWFETLERSQSVRDIADVQSKTVFIPLVVKGGFNDANALFSDFVDLLEAERNTIEPRVTEAARNGKPVAFVLVSRTRLSEPIIASPVQLPAWMAYAGGAVVPIELVDVASSATNTLISQSELVQNLQVELYEIEGLMLARLAASIEKNHNVTHAFFAEILMTGVKPRDFLHAANQRHAASSPQGFRPVASPAASELLGRIVGTCGDRPPSKLPKLATAMFEALNLTDAHAADIPEPFFGVAFRSTLKETESDRLARARRNALLALFAASQIITATMHAGEYGEFRVVVMRSLILDCAAVLLSLKTVLL